MYAKVESERLRFLRFNQAKLRSEEYIHLRDAVAGNIDGNLNPNDIGNAFILPSSYIGSPRNMQEYMQDAMTYVRHYGRPVYLLHSHVIRIGKRYKLYYCQDNKPSS
ncbi:helitron_like_N domain-containing protein [Trichonephila clavipes]|nr:helitron_like_N domain-containing protein [Trichonephila clavipes]